MMVLLRRALSLGIQDREPLGEVELLFPEAEVRTTPTGPREEHHSLPLVLHLAVPVGAVRIVAVVADVDVDVLLTPAVLSTRVIRTRRLDLAAAPPPTPPTPPTPTPPTLGSISSDAPVAVVLWPAPRRPILRHLPLIRTRMILCPSVGAAKGHDRVLEGLPTPRRASRSASVHLSMELRRCNVRSHPCWRRVRLMRTSLVTNPCRH